MFPDTPQGTTHSFQDRCGEPAHNKPMTEITALLQSLDEMRGLASFGLHTGTPRGSIHEDNYTTALHNAYPQLRAYIDKLEREAEAGRVLAEAVEKMGKNHDYIGLIAPFAPEGYGKVRDVVRELYSNERDRALSDYRTATDPISK